MKKKILIAFLSLSVLFALCACTPKKRTEIVFDLGNGETQSFTVEKFDELEVPEDPKREGYEFEGWYFDNEYKEAFTLTGLFEKERGGTITIYSKWMDYSKAEYKYEFYLDGALIGEETVIGMNAPKARL